MSRAVFAEYDLVCSWYNPDPDMSHDYQCNIRETKTFMFTSIDVYIAHKKRGMYRSLLGALHKAHCFLEIDKYGFRRFVRADKKQGQGAKCYYSVE
jgi:hypothetical protein